MPKATIPINGRTGVIALMLVIGMAFFRFQSLTSTDDLNLKQKILIELQSDSGNEVSKLLTEHAQDRDLTRLANQVQQLASEPANIYSVSVSKSLLTFSSSDKAVVKVEFSLPGNSKRQTRYYRARDSIVGGWTIQSETTFLAYLLNFI